MLLVVLISLSSVLVPVAELGFVLKLHVIQSVEELNEYKPPDVMGKL